jgi:hypothetical protein
VAALAADLGVLPTPELGSRMPEHRAIALLRQCEAAVLSGELQAELPYADSREGSWLVSPFTSAREALAYEFNRTVRGVADGWAPLGSPVNPTGFPDAPEGTGEAVATSIALFPKGSVLGYVVMREHPDLTIRISVGSIPARDGEDPPGDSGDGSEARVGLSVRKWVM